jgi:hypothetical protein
MLIAANTITIPNTRPQVSGGSPPPPVTYFILSPAGDILLSPAGDPLMYPH